MAPQGHIVSKGSHYFGQTFFTRFISATDLLALDDTLNCFHFLELYPKGPHMSADLGYHMFTISDIIRHRCVLLKIIRLEFNHHLCHREKSYVKVATK